MLAVGVYPLVWAQMVLFEDPHNERKKPEISAQMVMAQKREEGDAVSDEQTNVGLVFGTRATAVISCSLNMKTPPGRSVFVQGEKVGIL